MKKRIVVCLILIINFSILPGCWDYKEYENMAIIGAVGIDYNSQTDVFTVSLQKLSSSKSTTESSETSGAPVDKVGAVHSITCKTIYEGIAKFQTVITNKLFFGYTSIMMIGEDAAKYKLIDIVDLMDRTPSLRENAQVVIVQNAVESLSTVDYSKSTPSSHEISDLIEQSDYSGVSRSVSVQDFEEMLAISGLEAVAPHIESSSNQELEAKGGVEGDISSYKERLGNHVLTGTAVFKGDKFIGYLNDEESQGYLWITGQKVHEFTTSLPLNDGKNPDYAYYEIKDSKSSISVELENNQPTVSIKVNIRAELRKNLNSSDSDYLLQNEVDKLESLLSDRIQLNIEAALNKCQKEYKSDVFGFGFKLFRKNPKLWQEKYESEWEKIYPTIPVSIEVNSKITTTGSNIKKLIIK